MISRVRNEQRSFLLPSPATLFFHKEPSCAETATPTVLVSGRHLYHVERKSRHLCYLPGQKKLRIPAPCRRRLEFLSIDPQLRRVGIVPTRERPGLILQPPHSGGYREPRVANHVDEQDMCDLQRDLFLDFCGHGRRTPRALVSAWIISLFSGRLDESGLPRRDWDRAEQS